tara:strand:+ start:340 stop:501 length:162 start_codon:yes stop_codon:yes gene_type:complete
MNAEKIKLNEYQRFGLETLDEVGHSLDFYWFINDEEREKFINENEIKTIHYEN